MNINGEFQNLVKLARTVCLPPLSDEITSLSPFKKTVRPDDLLLAQTERVFQTGKARTSRHHLEADAFVFTLKIPQCNLHSNRIQPIAILLHRTHASILADGK